MITLNDIIAWWNLPFCWFFAILFSPIGFIIATYEWIDIKRKNKKVGNMYSYWASVLRPGFFFGLYFSILIIGLVVEILKLPYKLIVKR